MKAVGRFEIQSPVVSGTVETFTARDPTSGTTVLVHLLPAGDTGSPEKKFLEFAPGCPGKILDSGVDAESQRGFVVTDYPKDRKALLLWIKSLSSVAPKATTPAKPVPPPPPKPAAPPASDGATKMFDPSAMFGGPPAAAAPAPPAPASDGATRMFDPAAVFGGAPAAGSAAPPAGSDGATKMFDPSAMFGGVPSPPSPPAPSRTPPPSSSKTPPPASREAKRTTDPFADLKAALSRTSPPPPPPSTSSAPAKPAGEFTRRFELPRQFRNAPLQVDRTKETEAPKPAAGARGTHPEGDKGIFTLMMEAYAQRMDQSHKPGAPPAPATPPATGPAVPASDGATRMLDPAALFGGPPAPPEAAPPTPPAKTPGPAPSAEKPPVTSEPTLRMPALQRDDEDK